MITYIIGKKKMKQIFNLAVIVFTAAIVLSFVIFTKGVEELIHDIRSLNYKWIMLGMAFMFITWGIETVIFHELTTLFNSKQKINTSIRATMIGQFFSAVTPFASGGQPAQLYYMIKSGMDGGTSTSILTIKFILFQGIYILYSIIIIIFKFSFFKENLSNFLYISLLGFIVNISIILFIITAAINQNVARTILLNFLNLIKKLRLIKSKEKLMDKLNKESNNFHKSIIVMYKNLKIILKASLLTVLQLTVYSTVTYLIYRGFNLKGSSLWDIISAQTFLTMITSVIPLPGASGGSEGGFYLFFRMFFIDGTIISAVILWRIITYYLTIIIGSVFTIRNNL